MSLFRLRRYQVRKALPVNSLTGLKAWYQAKGNSRDAMGNANGDTVSTVTYEGGPGGVAFRFDGTSYVRIPYVSALAVTSAETIMCWVKLDQLPGGGVSYHVFGQSTSGNDNDLLIGYNVVNSWQFFGLPNGTVITAPVVPTPLVWYHLAVVCDSSAGVKTLYVNGEPAITGVCSARTNSVYDWSIGESLVFTGRKFRGLIGDVRMYNAALTATQLKQIISEDLTNLSRPRRNSLKTNQKLTISSFKLWLRAEGNTNDELSKSTAYFTGATAYASGNLGPGQAFAFSGSNYVRITYNSNLVITSALTLMCWFRLDSAPGLWHVFGQSTNGNDNDLLFNGATLQYYGLGASPMNCTTSFSTLTWYHVAVVCSSASNSKQFYVNGNPAGSTTCTARNNSTNDWSVAESLVFTGRLFKGRIDDCQVYNVALTQAQVRKVMNGGVLYET